MWWTLGLEVVVEPFWWCRTSCHVGTVEKNGSHLVEDDTQELRVSPGSN